MITFTAEPGHVCLETPRNAVEGYSGRAGLLHGSLDRVVYACPEYVNLARTVWLAGFTPYTTTLIGKSPQPCGYGISFEPKPAGQSVSDGGESDGHEVSEPSRTTSDLRQI